MTILRLTVKHIAALILSVPGTVATQTVADTDTVATQGARYAIYQSYGLGTEYESKKLPVVTYIPATFLLFNVNEEEPDAKFISTPNKTYSAVTTQDGVRLYMLADQISQQTVTDVFGSVTVIFNGKQDIRKCIQCDINDDDDVLEIAPGNAFTKSDMNGMIRLKGKRNLADIEGVISKAKLDKLNREGIVTFADQKQPRLDVTRREGSFFNRDCGKVRKVNNSVSAPKNKISDSDIIINNVYDIAALVYGQEKYSVTFKHSYGEKNTAFKFRVYNVVYHHENTERIYVAQIKYRCEFVGVHESMKQIINVILLPQEGKPIDLEPYDTPDDLMQKTGTPHYLYSVNSAKQYFALMAKLGDKFPNRAEAGYFLSEFNRSCSSKYRSEDVCRRHSYH